MATAHSGFCEALVSQNGSDETIVESVPIVLDQNVQALAISVVGVFLLAAQRLTLGGPWPPS